MTQRVLSAIALGALATTLALPALAQGASGYGPHVLPSTYKNPKSDPLPPGVPGARTSTAPAAEPSRLASDMSPNDALFDAINRGDLAAARDALNRGALLSAQNVLGMTPLDLSVDLGRDDITSVLLSMRGADPSLRSKPIATAVSTRPTKATKVAKPAPHVQTVARVQPVANEKPVAKVKPQPTRYADDSGTPNPAAGFLGFGAR
jgi:hypothetical protein